MRKSDIVIFCGQKFEFCLRVDHGFIEILKTKRCFKNPFKIKHSGICIEAFDHQPNPISFCNNGSSNCFRFWENQSIQGVPIHFPWRLNSPMKSNFNENNAKVFLHLLQCQEWWVSASYAEPFLCEWLKFLVYGSSYSNTFPSILLRI